MWIAVSVSTWHITTNVQTLCWSKSSPSFSSAHSSCISRSINNIFVPHIGMYIRINMSKTDFIYLKIWCDSVTICQRGHFFWLTLYIDFSRGEHSYVLLYVLHESEGAGTALYFWWYRLTTIVCIRSLFITYSYFNISAGYNHMLITYMYMPTDMYYYILDLSPLFLGCYLRPGLYKYKYIVW